MTATEHDRPTRVEVDTVTDDYVIVWLDNGPLRIGAVPALGGRLLSVRVHGVETLWRNPALLDQHLRPINGHVPAPASGSLGDWVNYGGDKTWPAPQGWSSTDEWAGPPDPVLDSGPYAWTVEEHHGGRTGAARLVMISGADPRTGLRLTREVVLHPGRLSYDLRVSATNVSDRPVRWSLWNVTQRHAGTAARGGVEVGVGLPPTSTPGADDVQALIAGTGVPRTERVAPGVVRVPHQDVVGKVGFPTATGWIAHLADGVTSTLLVDVAPEADYPDEGSRAEVWLEHPLEEPLSALGDLDPPDRIVEVEVLGPLVRLAPGEATTIDISCAAVLEEADGVLEVTSGGHRTGAGWTPYVQAPAGVQP